MGDWLSLSGLDVLIMDTAGITNSEHPVEREGVKRTKEFIALSDEVFFLLDGSMPLHKEDIEIAEYMKNIDKKHSLFINKSDLKQNIDENEVTDRINSDFSHIMAVFETQESP